MTPESVSSLSRLQRGFRVGPSAYPSSSAQQRYCGHQPCVGIVVRTGGVNEKGGIPNLGNMTASKRIGHVPREFL